MIKYSIIKDADGIFYIGGYDPEKTIHFCNGTNIYHRLDGPAIIRVDGTKEWWLYGHRHREDGPAIEYVNGNVSYYLHGSYNSQDDFDRKIAIKKYKKDLGEKINHSFMIENSDGKFYYNKYEQFHREDGPAVIFKNGVEEWRINGVLHRLNGPAIVIPKEIEIPYYCDRNIYYIEGRYFSKERYKKTLRQYEEKPKGDGFPFDTGCGNIHWTLNGLPHRISGPAYENKSFPNDSIYHVEGHRYTIEEFPAAVQAFKKRYNISEDKEEQMSKTETTHTSFKEVQDATHLTDIAKKYRDDNSKETIQAKKQAVYQEYAAKAIDLELAVKEAHAKSCFDLAFNMAKTQAQLGIYSVNITNKKIVDTYENNTILKTLIVDSKFVPVFYPNERVLNISWHPKL